MPVSTHILYVCTLIAILCTLLLGHFLHYLAVGLYNRPAKIRLGINSVDVLPVGRYSVGPLSLELLKAIPGNAQRWGDFSGGRVDITNGERRHLLLRGIEDGQDHWYTVGEPLSPAAFDRKRLEEILQDLLS